MKKEINITPKTTDIKNNKKKIWFLVAAIAAIFIIIFSYTFDKKPDLNGDASSYYMLANSISSGHGYKDISNVNMPHTNVFPPGYPLLMSAVMIFTDSIIAQKVLNGFMLFLAAVIFFLWLRKIGKPVNLGFVTAIVIIANWAVLKFATVMMSEMSFILVLALALYLLTCLKDDKFYKDKYFYLLIFVATYGIHIRTQGITLVLGVLVYFLFNKKWLQSAAFIVGVILLSLPWHIRNSMYDIGGRYVDQFFMVNPFRPEEGYVTASQFIARGFDTLGMLISQALPNSVFPYLGVNYYEKAPFSQWLVGLVQLGVIGVGFWQFKKYKWFFIGCTLAVGAVLFAWSAPSENRYITTLLPLLDIGMIVGLYTVICKILPKNVKFSPLILLGILIFAFPRLEERHKIGKMPILPSYANFISIAKQMDRPEFHDKVVSSRKPSVFYTYSKTFVCWYLYSSDRTKVVENLINNKADYVVLEQLGYASTALYLFPVIENNPDLFETVMHIPNPDTYLLKFNREKAIEKVKENSIR